MTQKIHLSSAEHTLIRVDFQAKLLKAGEHLAQVPLVLLLGGRCYEDVVDIHHNEVESPGHPVHEPLEPLRRPKFITGNSNNPKGVVTAVLGTSLSATGI